MHLCELRLNCFRNFKSFTILPHPRINLICGQNGSGKTNLLEAIYHLSTGKSFRTTLSSRIIQANSNVSHVYGAIERNGLPLSIGVQRQRDGSTTLQVNHQPAANASELAFAFPLRLINPDSFNLLVGGPKYRRQLLNWGVFHVEHAFWNTWKLTTRIIKQRNAALKKGQRTQVRAWDIQLEKHGQELLSFYQAYYALFEPIFHTLMREFLPNIKLDLRYYPGWDIEQPLLELLEVNYSKDQAKGQTHAGPHRADLRIKVKSVPAKDILSRGQQKLVVCALLLSQGLLLKQYAGIPCVYLLDDLAAELDEVNLRRVCMLLDEMGAQVFVTALDNRLINTLFPSAEVKLFHVEQLQKEKEEI